MLKKISIVAVLAVIIIGTLSFLPTAYAVTGEEVLGSDQATELVEIKESTKGKLDEYIEKYGSTPYGVAAYILNIVRTYSIPFCFVGIVVGSIYQYMLGIRKLDVRDKGFALVVTFVTVLLICQVLPLIFAIVVNGWRG